MTQYQLMLPSMVYPQLPAVGGWMDYNHPNLLHDNSRSYAFISHSLATYPIAEPSIDNMQLARRTRRRTSPAELTVLESAYSICKRPSRETRLQIARKTGMSERSVQIWFQNRRSNENAKAKRSGLKSKSSSASNSPELSASEVIPLSSTASDTSISFSDPPATTNGNDSMNNLSPLQLPAQAITSEPRYVPLSHDLEAYKYYTVPVAASDEVLVPSSGSKSDVTLPPINVLLCQVEDI
ncbi:hypothetical protein TRVA0_002S02872 [Trichomonascus vanleenenianus]|uniref:uncharacterized protein n=1 Tax=Trichomonascus vanleenenianus TaxID=2268995 RepID=UPI003EC97428